MARMGNCPDAEVVEAERLAVDGPKPDEMVGMYAVKMKSRRRFGDDKEHWVAMQLKLIGARWMENAGSRAEARKLIEKHVNIPDALPDLGKDIKITELSPTVFDEWVGISIRVEGSWKKPSGKAEEERLAQAIFGQLLSSSAWAKALPKIRKMKATTFDGNDDRSAVRSVPVPTKFSDIESWAVWDNKAHFEMAERDW